jgi:hypothetical protein
MKKLLALAFVLALTSAALAASHQDTITIDGRITAEPCNDCTDAPPTLIGNMAALFGPLFSGSSQMAPITGHAPVVTSNACSIALPVTNATNVNLVGGGTCNYTATCNSIPCNGGDAITSWAITAQSVSNSFSIVSANGILQGGSAAGSVTAGSYTVTVTATNSTGTSSGVVQTVTVVVAVPVVSALSCTIKTPITNNTNVTLQAGGNCQYTATNSPTSWAVTTDTCASCYQVTSAGILQGSTNAATVVNRTDTVTVTATNAGGTSAAVAQTVTAVSVPAITNQNFNVAFPVVAGNIGTMAASPAPATWTITAVSGGGTGATIGDFAITSPGGVLSATGPLTDITAPGTVGISLTATNATGTSPTGTATLSIGVNCPFGTALADGCTGAQAHGIIVDAHGADPGAVIDLNIFGGSGYTNGTYTWTSSGASCSPAATGTITVVGGKLGGATRGLPANFTISNHGAGCTANPTIAVPAGAGAGSGGSITPTVYTYTPHNASSKPATGIPNYNVAGVDYPIGYDRTLTLKAPTSGNLPSCATNPSGNAVTINSSNCTINGFNFNGIHLQVAGGLSNIVISNNLFTCIRGTTSTLDAINFGGTSVSAVIKYNDFNGGVVNATACVTGQQTAAVNGTFGTGTITIEYNYCYLQDAKCWNFEGGGTSGSPLAINILYNWDADMDWCQTSCQTPNPAHGEDTYNYAANGAVFATPTYKFNTAIIHFYYGSPNISTSPQALEADGYSFANPNVSYNMAMDRGTQPYGGTDGSTVQSNSAPMYCGHQEGGTITGTAVHLNNFVDASASYYPYNTTGGTCTTDYPNLKNYNLGTGAVCTSATSC